MSDQACPHLGTLDEQYNRGPNIDYPSFENRCLAVDDFGADDAGSVMLTDQATFCLSTGHRHCPRFQLAQTAAGSQERLAEEAPRGMDLPFESGWLHANLAEIEHEIADMIDEPTVDRRMWSWIGAGLTFLLVFLCGGTFAVYLGWQMVSSMASPNNGAAGVSIDTLAPIAPIATAEPIVVVITATSIAESADSRATPTAGAVLIRPEQTSVASFPAAVTATPGQPAPSSGSSNPGVIVVDPNRTGQGAPPPPPSAAAVAPTPTSPVNVDVVVPTPPTRRPTPTFEIPTSTPLPAEPTPTVTPTYGPAMVVFKPQARALEAGDCTLVTWNVRNVREVYYEGIGVPGQGDKEECLDDESEVYTLMVILGNGSTGIYTTTVRLLEPTPTPTYTPTWTPFPVYTPTWTPAPPPSTPTPVRTYGVDLLVNGGSSHSCAAGTTCRVGVTVSNLGNQLDDLTVQIIGSGSWSSQLCRADGVCAAGTLSIYNVGPGTGGTLNLVVDVPPDAGGQSMSYTLEASSGNAGGAVRSNAILIEIEAE